MPNAVRPARVLYEDDKYMTLEVYKDPDNTPLETDGSDRYLQVAFLKPDSLLGKWVTHIPWRH